MSELTFGQELGLLVVFLLFVVLLISIAVRLCGKRRK